MAQRKSKSEDQTKAELLRNLDKIKEEYLAKVKAIRSSGAAPRPPAPPLQGTDKLKREQKLRRQEEQYKQQQRSQVRRDSREPSRSTRSSVRGGSAASNTSSRKDGKSTLDQIRRLSNSGNDVLRIRPGMGTQFPGV